MTSKRRPVDQRQAHHVRQRPQRGFTLIELIIFIVVVAAGLAGILSVMNTVVKSSADPMIRKQTIAIAESMLEEILLKDYENPTGGDTGTVRKLFDDVGQYAAYSTPVCTAGCPGTSPTPAGCGVVDLEGTSVSSLCAYRILPSVSVGTTTLGTLTVKQVIVSVTGPQGVVSLTGYRACDLSPSCPLP
jgi:MSHA pilin protein MshD